jgi:hypothetical protein
LGGAAAAAARADELAAAGPQRAQWRRWRGGAPGQGVAGAPIGSGVGHVAHELLENGFADVPHDIRVGNDNNDNDCNGGVDTRDPVRGGWRDAELGVGRAFPARKARRIRRESAPVKARCLGGYIVALQQRQSTGQNGAAVECGAFLILFCVGFFLFFVFCFFCFFSKLNI